MQKTCFLLGFMGCGKTWWGTRLSERMNLPFVDLDTHIEKGEGTTIAGIFERTGENGFRELERAYLRKLATLPVSVVATGGGTPCFSDNMDWMNAQGLTLYLKTPVDVLAARLRLDRDARPLLQGISDHQLEEYLGQLLSRREPFYNQAKIIVEQAGREADFLAVLVERIRQMN